MATFTVTNVEERPNNTPWPWAKVTVTLAGPAYDSDGHQLGGPVYQQTDANGAVSFTGLQVGVTYVWQSPDKTVTTFQATAAGTFTLQSLAGVFAPDAPLAVTTDQLRAAIAAQAAADSRVYAPLAPLVAVDTDGVTYPLTNGGLQTDSDGIPYYAPPAGIARLAVDTDGVTYPVALSGVAPS